MSSEPAGPARPVSSGSLAALRGRVHGPVFVPGDDGYAPASIVWNREYQRRPAVIVSAATSTDVQATVRFARQSALPLAVRSGGYSPAGQSTCEGGVVLDLRGLRRVTLDPRRQRVIVQGGARWGDVDVATQRFGQVVPGAAVAGIGVAGSTLGGSWGHLRRLYGLACDNLLEADLIGADGEPLTTSGDERPELLWGLRGGGGNFGVATSMTFRLRPLPQPVLSGTVFYPAEHAAALLRFYRDWTAALREDVTTGIIFLGRNHAPELSAVLGLDPAAPVVGVTALCAGDPDEARALLAPMRSAGPVLRDLVDVVPYPAVQSQPDSAYPPGRHAVMDSGYLDTLDDDLIEALLARHAGMDDAACELHLQHMGGAVGRVARMSTAVPNRNARYFFSALARWNAPGLGVAPRDWLAGTGEALRAFTVGGPNVGMRSAGMSSIEAYGAERYLRLAALKRRYDPDNVFAINQNVTPLV
jgi:FAD/FMN-containing dehydrogenase